MRHTPLINYALYQAGWFACVLGGASQRPWTGFLIATILIGVHLTVSLERSLEVRLVVMASAVGLAVETVQIATGTYVPHSYRRTGRTSCSALIVSVA